MKRKLLFFVSGQLLLASVIFGQAPKVEITVTSIHQEMNLDDSVLIKIPVKSIGNRDLIWSAKKVTPEVIFSKANYADYTLTKNQDRLTKDIWITRANSQGIFNIAREGGYNNTSPEGTLWSYGTSDILEPGDYEYWVDAVNWNPPEMVNRPMSIYLPEYDEKINIIFKSWTSSGNGGGFSYVREGIATWLTFIKANGNIIPTKTDTLYVLLNTKSVFGGTYNANIVVKTNDPVNSEITIPVTLKVNAVPEIEVPVTSMDFSNIYVNDIVSLPLEILNNGDGELIINEVEGQNADFQAETVPVYIPGQSKSNFYIKFAPKNDAVYYDTLILKTNDPINPSISITLTGAGVQGTPQLTIDDVNIDFGDEYLSCKDSITIELQNTGTDQLIISDITNISNHYYVSKTNFNIAYGKSQNLKIYFKPEATGLLLDTLTIESNDPVNPLTKLYLSGNGLSFPVLNLSTQNIADTLNTGESATKQLTITNNGTEPISFVVYPVMPNSMFAFSKPDWADYTLPENQDRIAADVWITRANTQGIFNIAVETGYNYTSPSNTLWAWGHKFNNDASDYDYWGDAINWTPPNMVGNVVSMFLKDYHRYFDLYFTKWTQGGNGGGFAYTRFEVPSWLTADNYEFVLNAGQSVNVELTLDASDLLRGKYYSDIEIKSDYTGSTFKSINVALMVEGKPEIKADTVLDFANVVTKATYTKSLAIRNDGTDTLFVNNIQITGTAFTTIENKFYILPKNNKSIPVTLNSEVTGSISETLTIFSNDATHAQFNINLKANALENPVTITPAHLSYILPSDSVLVDTIFITNTSQDDVNLINKTKIQIGQCLDSLNNNYTQITDLIPNRYDFYYDGTNSISDGGDDMYDGGNYLYTNIDMIEYSDNVIRSGDYVFGANTEYFTRHLPGLFVLMAGLNSISEFYTDGNLGADGYGNVDTTRLVYEKGGIIFTGFVKRVYDAEDPSVNHLIIIPDDTEIRHIYDISTNIDYHSVSRIEDAQLLAYLLYASADGGYIDNQTTLSIMKSFVDNIFYYAFGTDTIKTGITYKKEITIDTRGLKDGEYNYNVTLGFVNPVPFEQKIPVDLKVENIRLLKPYADTTLNEGFTTLNVDLTGRYFAYGNDLTSILVISSNENVATVALEGSQIHVNEKAVGTTLITVRAEDSKGNVLYSDFNLRINAIPVVANPLADVTVDEGFVSRRIGLAGVFADADNESLNFSVSSSNTSVVTASISGNEIVINEAGLGTAVITVRATDSNGAMAQDQFNFTVNQLVPVETIEITGVRLYPNPATEAIFIEFDNMANGTIDIEVTNISGVVVLKNKLALNSGIARIDLVGLQKGVYFVRYKKDNISGYQKIILN